MNIKTFYFGFMTRAGEMHDSNHEHGVKMDFAY